MAKALTFTIKGTSYAAEPEKIERKKLYGWSEIKAFDDAGDECSAVQIDEGGALIIPKGGIGLGILSPQGRWVDRSSLKALTLDGKDAPLVPSSYDEPVVLSGGVSVDEFLDHTITAFYQLNGAPEKFIKAIGDGIFSFTYNLRADYEGSPAFLLVSEGVPYMFTGYKNDFPMIGLEETGVIEEEDGEGEEAEDEELDFSFM